MKKLLALLMAFAMTLTLASCTESEVLDTLDYLLTAMEEDTSAEDVSEPVSEAADTSETVTVETPDLSLDADPESTTTTESGSQSADYVGGDFELDEDGTYTSYEEVALYIVTYEHLPDNFMTKKEAQELGWNGGGLDDYAYGMCIGGDTFGNKEGLLPKAKGRTYHECDIDTLHANKRGAERIVYSNDGLVYYTSDHYETFTLLYGIE